jgi:DNA mismatch repair protein MutS2
VVHGHSGSRATLFVEPLEVVEQNNRLAELRMEERAEVERILRELSALVAKDAVAIGASIDAASAIDAVTARARFGAEFGAVVPQLSGSGGLVLRSARHPLIVAKHKSGAAQDAVPNDIVLSGSGRTLIISGPNAGGKTVILKTVGLLCLMAQAGMPVTAAEGSELPVLSGIFADIGDEQSLEQDISTFSSHVRQIAAILREASADSLVLLDELGSGTDPAEGAALGSAVMAGLLERGCLCVVTTHHSGLKLFGARTAGAVNGAMEFDPETLKPTYRFIPGRPGRSYGLDMAARLGVPDSVMRDARSRLTGEETGLDRLLEQVERDSRELRSELQRAAEDRQAADKLKAEAEQLRRAAAEEERNTKAKAKTEAREVLASLRQKLKDLSKATATERSALAQERREIEQCARTLEPAGETCTAPQLAPADVRPGDRVRVPRLKKTGTVLFASHDSLEVEADGLKLRLPLREVVLAGPGASQAQAAAAPGWSAELGERAGLPDRVNLLGLRVDEALIETERFLDHAAVQGFRQVVIIHGLGTGALRDAVRAEAATHPLVRAVRPGERGEGGDGATVVTF